MSPPDLSSRISNVAQGTVKLLQTDVKDDIISASHHIVQYVRVLKALVIGQELVCSTYNQMAREEVAYPITHEIVNPSGNNGHPYPEQSSILSETAGQFHQVVAMTKSIMEADSSLRKLHKPIEKPEHRIETGPVRDVLEKHRTALQSTGLMDANDHSWPYIPQGRECE